MKRSLLKMIAVSTTVLFCNCALSWDVVKTDEDFFMQESNLANSRKIQLQYNGIPSLDAVTKYSKDIEFIDYFSGSYGTSSIIKVYRRIVFNKKLDKVLIDAPLRYIGGDMTEPIWEISKDKEILHVVDEEESIDINIKLK